jgi:DNA-directed RNA polymerase specialized sigma24 family protein
MESIRLSALLREAFAEALRKEEELTREMAGEFALADLRVWDLPRLMHDRNVPLAQQDELLAAVVRCYRRSPSGWSAVLLEMLAPALVSVCRRILLVPRGVDADDIHQQVIVEALAAAATMPMHEPPQRMQRRIALRVTTMTVRWLVSVVRSEGESLVDVGQQEPAPPPREDRLLIQEMSEYGVPAASLALLYRSQVLGQTFVELAIELGIAPDAVRNRQRRALARLRRARPDLFGRLLDGIRPAA